MPLAINAHAHNPLLCGPQVQRVDAEILGAVRAQSSSGARARGELAGAQSAIEELVGRIHEIQRKAEQSEMMVQEICRDIKKLDNAKKHLTATITALRRLSMLVNAVGAWRCCAASCAAPQLQLLSTGWLLFSSAATCKRTA